MKIVYDRIALDPRHHRVSKLIEEPGAARVFSDWSMGFAAVTPRDLAIVPGCNDFFRSGKCYADLSTGVARDLLAAFRGGRFRTFIK